MIVIKAKRIFAAVVVLIAVICFSVVVSLPTSSSYDLTIVVDAGHGGIDGGVVGSLGVKESEINLAIAKHLRDFLESSGYKVVMTRDNDNGLYGAVSTNKKKADMQKRKEIINSASPDFVVSIHQNYYPSSYVSGAQIFYAPNGKSKAEAEIVQASLNRQLCGKRTAMTGDYYILQCSSYPSLLVECGFLSNPDEEAKLVTADYQREVAYAIFSSLNLILYDRTTA